MKAKNTSAVTRRARFWSAARGLAQPSNPERRSAGALATLALAGSTFLVGGAQGQTYIYTPTNNGTGPDNWSTSPNFSPTPPVSGAATTLTFVGTNTTPLASGLVNTSTNNLGDFLLNILNLQGTDPTVGGTAATININSAAGSFLDFRTNGTATPVINLNALATNGTGLVYNVNSNAVFTNNTTIQGAGTATFNFNGNISGAGGLTMSATGVATLAGANTYAGGTTVNSGTLNLGSTTALGTGALTLNGGFIAPTATATSTNISTTAAAAINITSGAYTFAGAPAISANINLTGATGGNIVKSVGAGNPVFSGNLDLGGVARTFALSDTGGDAAPELTVSGVIANGSVVMDNTFNGASTQEFGSLFFSGANTYAGGTTVNVGRLETTNASGFGTGTVTVGTRGTVAIGGSGQAASVLALPNNFSFGHTVNGNYGQDALQVNSGSAILSGTVTLTANTQFNVGGGLTINANDQAADVITGAFALTKTGGGNMTLLGAQTYSGGTTITGGQFQLGDGVTDNGSVTGTINQTGGRIIIQNVTAQTFSNTVTGTGGFQINGNAPVTISSSLALSQFLINANTVTLGPAVVITSGTNFTSIGVNAFESATLNMTGASSLAVPSDFNIGDNANSNGILNVGTAAGANPTLTVTTLYDGKGNNVAGAVTTGIVNQGYGTVNVTGGGESRIGGGVGVNDALAVGVYNLSGGALNTGTLQIGGFGSGQLLQTGGTYSSNSFPSVGRFAGGYGVVDVSAGTFSQTDASHHGIVGEVGTGIMTVRGTGAASFVSLSIGQAGGAGIFNLNTGGTLTTGFVSPIATAPAANTVAGSTAVFNFNGGTLKNTGASTNFFNFLTTANVFAGGAIFDTTNGSVTVGQSLVAPAGRGVGSVTVTNGGSGYLTPPIVRITGGTGTGATGVATINGAGQVTGIVITNPGTGYVAGDAVTVNLITAGSDGFGGISGTGAVLTPNIVANISGGLTKQGANSLTLSGTNTYTGATTVSAGTLVAGSAGAIPAATALVNNAATVNFNAQYGKAANSATPALTLSGLTAGATSTFNFGLSATGADYIAFTNAATVTTGAKFTLSIAAGTTSLTPGTYNLFTDAAGGLTNFALSTTSLTVNGQAYTFSLNATNTADILTISAAQVAKLYYTGNASNNLNVAGNYSTDAAGTMVATSVPSAITDVVFTATTGTTANFSTTLGGVTSVNSLEFTGTGTAAATTPVNVGGPGTLTLNATANTFAAGTGIVVDAGAAADTISANLNLATSETFINNSTSRLTISGAIGSAGAGTVLTMNDAGGGGFLLSGANTYTGSTVIAAGTTALGSSTALGNAANTVALNAGTLDINGQTVTQSSLTMAGGILADSAATPGSLVLSTPGTTGAAVNITGTYAPTAFGKTGNISLTGATNFIAKSTGNGQLIAMGGVNLNAGATTFALADSPGDAAPELALEGTISGTGSITVNNAATVPGVTLANTNDYGTLYLSGTNTYSGGTNITHGRIVATSSNALGTGPVVISQIGTGGGTLQLGNSAYALNSSPLAVGVITTGITLPNAITLGGQLGGGTYGVGIFNDSGNNTLTGAITLASANQIIFPNVGSLTISGPIGSSIASTTLTTIGTAGLTLSGNNTYTGATVIAASGTGVVTLGSSTALGNAANPVSITGGALNVNGQTVTQSSLTLNGGIVTDTATTRGTLTLSSTGSAVSIPYPATAPGGTAVVGYTNPVAVATVATNLALTGATSFVSKASGFGTPVFTGGLALSGATTVALADTSGDAAAELSITGVVSGPGSLTMNNQATVPGVTLANTVDFGTLLLGGTNTYAGGTNITHGRIVVTGNNALGTGPVVITQIAAGGGGTLQLGNTAYSATSSPLAPGTITGITLPNAISLGGALSGSYTGGIINNNGANTLTGNVTLTNASQIIAANGGTLTMSGILSQSAGVTASLTKSGAGTLALTNALNTYTGVTSVTGGTLSAASIVNGGLPSSIGASTNAPANLVLSGNGILAYTGAATTTDRGFTIGGGGGGIDNANALTFSGQVLQTAAGSFTKNNTGTLTFTNVTGTNTFTGGVNGNGFGFVANGGVTVLGGTATVPLAQTNQINGQFIVGTINSATSPNAEVDINGGTTTITDYIGIGRGNGTNNAATILTLNNNAVVTSPNLSVGYNNGVAGYTSSPTFNLNGSSSYTDAGVFRVGESTNGAGGVSTINVNGTATVTTTSTTAAFTIGQGGAGVINQSGGTVTAGSTITMGGTAGVTGTYNLNGGLLKAVAIVQGTGTGVFNFNGGTLQPTASDNPGTTTFMTGVAATVSNGGAIINTNGFNVTDASIISAAAGSTGGLTKNGTGILTLAAANTYVGATTINAGTLTISANGGLAKGNVTVATGATLSLATGVTAAHNAANGTTLTLTSTATSIVNLLGTGVQDTVAALVINGVTEPFGTYGAPGSGATFTNFADFTGTGQLLVAAVPEPSTWAALAGGVGLLAFARRRQIVAWLRTPRLA